MPISFENFPYYTIQYTLVNNQSTATPAPFQQPMFVKPNPYMNTSLSNIFWSLDPDGNQPIYSWQETGVVTQYTGETGLPVQTILYWLKLPNGIPANGSLPIYLQIDMTGASHLGGYAGVAPNLTSTYGQYDSGVNVFNYYTNFAGTSLPSGWTSYTSDGSVTVNNGVLIKGSTSETSGENGIAYQASSGIGSPPYVVDYGTQQTTSPSGEAWGWNAAGLSNYIGSGDGFPFEGGNYLLVNFEAGTQGSTRSTYAGSVTNGTLPTPSDNTFIGVFTQEITSSDYYTYYNYTQSTGYVIGTTLGTTSLPFVIMVGNNEATYAPNGQEIYWFRIRAYPPNGAYPSVY